MKDKPKSINTSIRLDADVHTAIEIAKKAEDRSASNIINRILRQFFKLVTK